MKIRLLKGFWVEFIQLENHVELNELYPGTGLVEAMFVPLDEHKFPRKLGTLYLLNDSLDLPTIHHECTHIAFEILRRLTGSKVNDLFPEHEETSVRCSEKLFSDLINLLF